MKTLNLILGTLVLSLLFYSCDKNEFAPVIVEQDFTVAEGTPEGSSFGTVVATDADAGQRLSYEIVDGNMEDVFDIDGSTGSLLVNDAVKLDYESTMHYILRVVVSDNHKNDPLESSAKIFIDVTDANEFAPQIPGLEDQVFTVLENSPSGTLIGVVQATDADSEQVLTYRISGGNESEIFGIDPVSGSITVASSLYLDYETDTTLMITISVTDSHEEDPLESSATIRIDLLDENEFTPVTENYSFDLFENPLNGQKIGIIQATDEDTYQKLTYSLLDSDENENFQIDSQTGSLSVKDSIGLDFGSVQQLTLLVEVSDGHMNPRTAQATITVNILAVKEITDGLVAYYPFNGNAMDESGHGINGAVSGAVLTTDRNGEEQSAYLFDGVDDYIELTNSEDLHFVNQDFSISVWYKLKTLEITSYAIISAYSSSGNSREYRLGTYTTNDSIYFKIYNQGVTSNGNVVFGDKSLDWSHVTITKTSSDLKYYLNGQLIDEIQVSAQMILTGTKVLLGADDKSFSSPDNFFNGKIDDIYIHNRALEDWEIANLFQMY